MFDQCCPKLLAPKAVTKKAQQKLRSSLKRSRQSFHISAGKHWHTNTAALAQSTRNHHSKHLRRSLIKTYSIFKGKMSTPPDFLCSFLTAGRKCESWQHPSLSVCLPSCLLSASHEQLLVGSASAFQSNHPLDIPQQLLWLGLVPHRQTDRSHSTSTAPLAPHSDTPTTPQQPPTPFLGLAPNGKEGVYKGLGPGPWIILSYLQRGFKINPASLHSAISVTWTASRGKAMCDFETVWVNCYWNRWNVNENKV